MAESEAGKYHDRKGVPIHPGDLLRSDHFRDRRNRMHYLYHVVVEQADGHLEMVPTSHLAGEEWIRGGGRCWLNATGVATQSEVICGHGPGDYLSYEDRPRVRPEPKTEGQPR
jgi:hypothetical protein